jgi:hypothetical protein
MMKGLQMNSENEDRKNNRRQSFKKKISTNKVDYDIEKRDRAKIKNQLKTKIERIREEEIWEDWENEIR